MENKQYIKVLASVVVVNYNGAALLAECLDSLLDQTYKNIEIIVVDNGSTDGSCELVAGRYAAKVKLIKNEKNTGFASGNNTGITAASGEYLILVNNDTKADHQFIEELITAATSEDGVGMCACKLLNYYDPRLIDAVGHLIYKDGLNQGRGRFERDEGQYDRIEEVIYPPGCGALYKRTMLDDIGLFDASFFAYGDDTDMGLRARLLGWKSLYAPKAVMYHKISKTGGQYSAFKLFFVERNRLFVIFKYYPPIFLVQSFFYTGFRYWLQFLFVLQGKGASKKYMDNLSAVTALRTILAAYCSCITHLPSLIAKRRELRARRKISNSDFIALFRRFGISAQRLVSAD